MHSNLPKTFLFQTQFLITHRNSIFIVKGDIRKAVSNRIYQNLVFMITSSIFPAAIERMENCLHELISMISVIFWHPTLRETSLNRDRFDSPLTYTDETEFFLRRPKDFLFSVYLYSQRSPLLQSVTLETSQNECMFLLLQGA